MEWTETGPRDLAARILTELFRDEGTSARNDMPGAAGPAAVRLLPFQEEAAIRARAILGRYGGVVVADSVGMGKTYVALALVADALEAGGRAGLIVPAALRPKWSSALKPLRDGHPGSVTLASDASLSRGTHPRELAAVGLVVVDEAHRFRNRATRRYAALSRLVAAHPVEPQGTPPRLVLLTATPINNHPADLYHLLRLFARDDEFRELGVPSLVEAFGAPGGGRSGSPADLPAIRRVADEVVIRRTRATARVGSGRRGPDGAVSGALTFPRRLPPRLVRYDGAALREAVSAITRLELLAHEAGVTAGRGASAGGEVAGDLHATAGAADLVRLGLLKRLESSRAGALISVRRHLGFLRAFSDAAVEGRLLALPHLGGRRAGEADPAQLMLLGVVARPAPPGVDLRSLLASAARDRAILEHVASLLSGPDPKIERCRLLALEIAAERVVVFTEFRDTAAALWRALAPDVRVARIDGSGAWLGLRPASRAAVLARFAPGAFGRREPAARERVDVLIATEVLGEGMDLQDARHVVSFDLPWNPVRLLQRIGRVDRLGSPHAEVVPHLFVPDGALDAVLGLTRRVRLKLEGMAGTVWPEGALELLDSLGRGRRAVAEALERADRREHQDALESLRVLRRSLDLPGQLDPVGERAPSAPRMAAGMAVVGTPVVLVSVGRRRWLLELNDESGGCTLRPPGADGIETIRGALDLACPAAPVPPPVLRVLDRLARELAARTLARGRAPATISRAGPAARAARYVRRAVEAEGTAASPTALALADDLLRRLSRPLLPPVEADLERLMRSSSRIHGLSAWLRALRATLGHEAPAPPTVPARPSAPRVARAGQRDGREVTASTDSPTASQPMLILALVPAFTGPREAVDHRLEVD